MFRTLISLGALSAALCASMPAQAQYYPPPPPGYYYDDGPRPPPRRYRYREYYAQDPYYAPRPYYGQGYGPGPRGDSYGDPMRPRIDPRNGGTYCVMRGYTVQDGVCKPYTGR